MHPFEVRVPGSTANLGSGFDSVGMAIDHWLTLHVTPALQTEVVPIDPHLREIQTDGENLILQVMAACFAEAGQPMPQCRVEVSSDIPLARGLGSSAAAIVGGLAAANHLLGEPWERDVLYQKAVRWEGHPDNVGASLFGGVVIASWDGDRLDYITASPPPFLLVAAVPRMQLKTAKARQVLPNTLAHPEAVMGSSRANLLVAGLLTGDRQALAAGLNDRFHQPYRTSLVPGLKAVLEGVTRHGGIGAFLSGAGPTVMAFADDPVQVERFLVSALADADVQADVYSLESVSTGATVRLTAMEDRSTVCGNIKGASASR
ncbi:homoserine kinase [Desmospora profundinema]|uniref:Homoserine kinase n=1 Tax=Desmospora profundinema TaxID=1571184 RepID=A0ABU1IRM2_9BACL|nr:homoserine kinase [Desmospora profundinema]MDR6226390.1 homoserine kinase [Desmospora profundinema]